MNALHSVAPGTTVRWYRYFRFGDHRFNTGTVLRHIPGKYMHEIGPRGQRITHGVTLFGVALDNGNVLVVPMSSDLVVRDVQTQRLARAA